MAENELNQGAMHRGQLLLTWEVDEYPRYDRGRTWYMVSLVLGALLLIYAVATGNFLFALIILMSALVIYLSTLGEPARMTVALTDAGVGVGEEFYPFKEIRRYWFIYDPPEVKNLYLDFKSPFRPRLAVALEDQNPNVVRTVLGQFVHEDFSEEEEPFTDFIGRIFKI